MEKMFGDKMKEMKIHRYIPPSLLKVSVTGARSNGSMLMGSIELSLPTLDESENPQEGTELAEEEECDDEEEALKLKKAQEKLKAFQQSASKLQLEINDLAVPGASIVDRTDGKTIDKIVPTPAPGTTVLLAQMRLDSLVMLGNAKKMVTNK